MTVIIAALDAVSDIAGLVTVLGAGAACALLLPSAWGKR